MWNDAFNKKSLFLVSWQHTFINDNVLGVRARPEEHGWQRPRDGRLPHPASRDRTARGKLPMRCQESSWGDGRYNQNLS